MLFPFNTFVEEKRMGEIFNIWMLLGLAFVLIALKIAVLDEKE